MVKTIFKAQLRPLSQWVILIDMLTLWSGCQTEESPLSQKAAAMVIVVQDMVTNLSTALKGLVAEEILRKSTLS
jgi:hypothetical protein